MKKTAIAVHLIFAGALLSGSAMASGKAHWGYTGHESPENWGKLSPEFATCSSGKNQSPINITSTIEAELPKLMIDYAPGGNEVVNNGHTIQVNYAAGSTLTLGDIEFELKQFHFHTPSENTIEGESFPMEAHFVHAAADGTLAVIGVMFKQGESSKELEKAWSKMPMKGGDKAALTDIVDASAILPTDQGYYRFNGSLTTPPCSEGVNWFVMKTASTASKEQIDRFTQTMGGATNRPVQPVNARVIVQ
ncbi:carbonic anhydrase [Desulfosediminicola flagellatus]|uniref:carbonic anhydrase n=1 Tax=Desulfosediminicola flagellatus TaxID=2569541 RepID=UPI0010ABD29B|nr:carbonic anhydrase family protein [Desulfosediminicola flagellatus]